MTLLCLLGRVELKEIPAKLAETRSQTQGTLFCCSSTGTLALHDCKAGVLIIQSMTDDDLHIAKKISPELVSGSLQSCY